MERHEATVEKQGACMQNVFLGGDYRIMSHFKDTMPVFVKQESTGVLRTARQDAGRPRSVRTIQFEGAVLQRIEDNPSTSTRAIAKDLNTSNANVWNVLQEIGMQPFKIQKVQDLSADDFPQRVAICQWYLHKIVNIPDFHTSVLFTDEATFTREGIFNSHNSHVWDFVNPKATRVFRQQHRFTINVWAGIVHDHLIGSYLLPTDSVEEITLSLFVTYYRK